MLIEVISQDGHAPGAALAARFADGDGGDIGRSADCTLALPDPERRISRKHLQVSWRDGRHHVRHIGANRDVTLDGVALAPGEEKPLPVGARLEIGPYKLQVAAEAPRTVAERASVFGDLLAAAGSAGGEIDLLVGEARPDAADAMRALHAGLGLPPPEAMTAAQWQRVGGLLRASIGGAMALLASRQLMKRELGAAPTQLRSLGNNPLKFAPDVDTALAQLLGPQRWGFMDAEAAVDDAFEDLRRHELALMTGLRAALHALVARFDPDALEARAAPQALDPLLPAKRGARLWDDYRAQYARVLQEVEGDFESLAARAFAQAYEATAQPRSR